MSKEIMKSIIDDLYSDFTFLDEKFKEINESLTFPFDTKDFIKAFESSMLSQHFELYNPKYISFENTNKSDNMFFIRFIHKYNKPVNENYYPSEAAINFDGESKTFKTVLINLEKDNAYLNVRKTTSRYQLNFLYRGAVTTEQYHINHDLNSNYCTDYYTFSSDYTERLKNPLDMLKALSMLLNLNTMGKEEKDLELLLNDTEIENHAFYGTLVKMKHEIDNSYQLKSKPKCY